MGERGSIAVQNNTVVECKAKKILKIRDLTGAGDLFAAGFLHGYVNKNSLNGKFGKRNTTIL